MANINITVNNSTFYVIAQNVISTDCASIYKYDIYSTNGDDIDITLSGDHEDAYYILDGGSPVLFSTSVTGLSYLNSLEFGFILQNSGSPGTFYDCDIIVDNNTVGGYNQFTAYVQRTNDDLKCVYGGGSLDYDDLNDTPNTKVGNALLFPRVNAAETAHEYVVVIQDRHYEHDQPSASATWNINHNLSKFPSVTIVNTSGDEVEGEVNFVDNNNITITFSASFAGKAYLN